MASTLEIVGACDMRESTGDEGENSDDVGESVDDAKKSSRDVVYDALDPLNAGERLREIQFWESLTSDQREVLIRVSEDIPIDRMAGLVNPAKKIWVPRKFVKSAAFVFIICRMCINVAVVWSTGFALRSGHLFVVGWDESESKTEMHNGYLRICQGDLEVEVHNETLEGTDCVRYSLARLNAYRGVAFVEFFLISLMVFVCISFSAAFVCGCTTLPHRCPFVFVVLPPLAAKVSSLSFLQFVNLERLKSLFIQGEADLLWSMIRQAVKGMCKHTTESQRLHNAEQDWLHRACYWYPVAIVIYVLLIALSFQALLVKLTVVHFASIKSFYVWSWYEWLLVVGFLNQLSGICFVNELEMHRVMLFKFGGPNALWTKDRRRTLMGFLELLTKKVTEGKLAMDSIKVDTEETHVGESGSHKYQPLVHLRASAWDIFWSRVSMLCAMCTIGSIDVQALLLSVTRFTTLRKSREQRLETSSKLFGDVGEYSKDLEAAYFARKALKRESLQSSGVVYRHESADNSIAQILRRREELLRSEVDRLLLHESRSTANLLAAARLQEDLEDIQAYCELLSSHRQPKDHA